MRRERKVTGENACWAVLERRPEDALRCFVLEERVADFRPLMKLLAERRLPYHVVEREQLDRVAGGTHHEGICLLALERPSRTREELCREAASRRGPLCTLYLDGVQNPHNLGAIVRSAAHFGALAVLVPARGVAELGPAGARVAEGGAEYVPLVALDDPPRDIAALAREGFALVGTDSEARDSLHDVVLPPRVILALGAEREGLSPALRDRCDLVVRIPGTGDVQSLNVSAAAAVLLSEHHRQHARR